MNGNGKENKGGWQLSQVYSPKSEVSPKLRVQEVNMLTKPSLLLVHECF